MPLPTAGDAPILAIGDGAHLGRQAFQSDEQSHRDEQQSGEVLAPHLHEEHPDQTDAGDERRRQGYA